MEFMVLLLALSGYVVTTKASLEEILVQPGVIGGVFKGPNSETIIKGPDGSVITSAAEGGSVITQPDVVSVLAEGPEQVQSVTPVAEVLVAPELAAGATSDAVATPVVASVVTAAPVAAATPVVASAPVVAVTPVVASAPVAAVAPVVAVPDVGHTIEIVQPDPHIIETELVDAPLVEPQEATDLVGPSGSISTRGSSSVVSGPASTTISEPAKIVVATPVVAAVPVTASVKTPLRAVPVREVVPDIPPPVTSFVLPATVQPVTGSPLVSVSPATAGSTLPPTALNSIPSSTALPPLVSISTPATLLSSTVANNLVDPQQDLVLQNELPQLSARVEPASSFGVIENAGGTGQAATTLRSELSVSSTPSPLTPELNQNSLNYAIVNNRQLGINPSLIPPANIIPPEIGPLSTITVSSTPSPLPTIDSSNIQAINNAQVINQVNAVQVQNQETSVQVASNPNIPQDGIIGAGLAKYGIDSTQINLAEVPLSSARRIGPVNPPLDQEADDSSSTLWNRYGRDVIEKDKTEKSKKD